MDKLTRHNIAYNLKISPHTHTVAYSDGVSIKYIFSSAFYLNNFKRRLEENRDRVQSAIEKKYQIKVNTEKLADLYLYQSIEKRGFLLEIIGDEVQCLVENKNQFAGEFVMIKI